MSWLTGDLVIVPLHDAVSKLASPKAQLVVCDQGTEEWHEARTGIPTGSISSDIVTPKGKPREGKAVEQLAFKLAMDKVYGRDLQAYQSYAMEMGNIGEPKARDMWAKVHGIKVEQVGFVYGDASKTHGTSPDGLFVRGGKLGCLEIKVLQRNSMCAALALGDGFLIPPDHYTQLQFNMWECGATVGVYINFFDSDAYPLLLEKEVGIDEEMFAGFEEAIPVLCNKVKSAIGLIRSQSKCLKDASLLKG